MPDSTVYGADSRPCKAGSGLSAGPAEAAHTLAYVTLDEGPTLLTNLVGGSGGYAVGQRVRVVFTPSDGGHAVPMFTPTEPE